MPSRAKPARPSRRATAPKRPAAKSAKPTAKARPPAKSPPHPAAHRPAPKHAAAPEAAAAPPAPRPLGRQHLLSLSFLRDGDEFLARIESDSGQITELKNRVLDQLLTLVAGELEDLLE